MKKRFPNILGLRLGTQSGFTLVELLIVVAIIVGLAAAIIPNISRFTGKGEEGAKAAESEAVQAAMDAMMAEQGIILVTGLVAVVDSSGNDWTALPDSTAGAAGYLAGYLREDSTTYFYCYDGTGKITQQDTAATACP